MSDILPFPDRHQKCIWLLRNDPVWFTIAPGGHAWLHTSSAAGLNDALWLSENFGLPTREPTQRSS
jgi:hypothetical protein